MNSYKTPPQELRVEEAPRGVAPLALAALEPLAALEQLAAESCSLT